MSSNRRKLRLNTVTVNLGCSSCRRPRLSNIFHPNSKSKTPTFHKKNSLYQSSSISSDTHYADEYDTTTIFSLNTGTPPPCCSSDADDSDIKSLTAVQGFGRIGGESVAVEIDSDDPYLDFRRSMLEMILEKEIYSKEDLRELLDCFLQLNSPYHHGLIVRAFTDIWNGVFPVKPASPKLQHFRHK